MPDVVASSSNIDGDAGEESEPFSMFRSTILSTIYGLRRTIRGLSGQSKLQYLGTGSRFVAQWTDLAARDILGSPCPRQ